MGSKIDNSIYIKRGHINRGDYLMKLADEYDIDIDVVLNLAQMLGPSEDFDGLINALEDYDE